MLFMVHKESVFIDNRNVKDRIVCAALALSASEASWRWGILHERFFCLENRAFVWKRSPGSMTGLCECMCSCTKSRVWRSAVQLLTERVKLQRREFNKRLNANFFTRLPDDVVYDAVVCMMWWVMLVFVLKMLQVL